MQKVKSPRRGPARGKKRAALSAQQTIPYVAMHPDGVCQLPGGRYTAAMVAEELCTTNVIPAPRATPSTGMWLTCPIRLVNTGLLASGFITLPIISMPSKSRPKEKITMPIFLRFSFLQTKFRMNPMKIIG